MGLISDRQWWTFLTADNMDQTTISYELTVIYKLTSRYEAEDTIEAWADLIRFWAREVRGNVFVNSWWLHSWIISFYFNSLGFQLVESLGFWGLGLLRTCRVQLSEIFVKSSQKANHIWAQISFYKTLLRISAISTNYIKSISNSCCSEFWDKRKIFLGRVSSYFSHQMLLGFQGVQGIMWV